MTSHVAPAERHRHPIVEVMADRSYRSFWVSSFLSAIIFGGARFAWVWVVLEATDSSADAALAGGFALGLPNLLFSLHAGAYADRFDRRKMVIGASLFATVVLVVTALLAHADRLGLVAALATAFGLGMTVSVTQPVQTAMVPQLVPPRLHLTGIALQNMSLQ
ncbi:MAG: MFS transporter, partial [Acidimicrobiia bacterium]|nr:MFS transporter [Acidimicrobiia bacterium]